MKQTMIAVTAALAAMAGWAGESAEFRLDTMDGTRTARAVETIAYSTEWNGGGTVSVAVDGVAIKEANAPATEQARWRRFPCRGPRPAAASVRRSRRKQSRRTV